MQGAGPSPPPFHGVPPPPQQQQPQQQQQQPQVQQQGGLQGHFVPQPPGHPPPPPPVATFSQPPTLTPGPPFSQHVSMGKPSSTPHQQQFHTSPVPPVAQAHAGGPPTMAYPSVGMPPSGGHQQENFTQQYSSGGVVTMQHKYGMPASTGPLPPNYDTSQQNLPEHFSTLSLGSEQPTPTAGPPSQHQYPGSMQQQSGLTGSADIDMSTLPRPLVSYEEASSSSMPLPGSCHPEYMRLTTRVIPNSSSLRARWSVPLGIIVSPLSSRGPEVPVVDFGNAGIIRCRRCRTYINPYVSFTDGGRRWRCNVCGHLNEVPVDYFCTLEATGRRRDHESRPELCQGSVEYVAPAEYMVRPPMPPVYFFVIDISLKAVSSGMVATAVQAIKQSIDRLTGDGRTQIGFITFDSCIHYYSFKSSLSMPQMIVVTDIDDVFLPQPEDLLVNLVDSRDLVDAFLDMLPSSSQAASNTLDSALVPALQAAQLIISHIGGKLLVFQASLPSIGSGRLNRRDDPSVYGTEREHHLRMPANNIYKKIAADCSRMQICVDVYLCAVENQYMDVATVGTLAKYSGGQVYFYGGYLSARDGKQLYSDVIRNLTRHTGWESVMRIRCGKGLRIGSFHGNFFIRSSDLLAIPAVDCDKSYAVQIIHDETMVTTSSTFFQCALLYTSSEGERRIRVHSLAVPVVSDLSELYAKADGEACIGLLSITTMEKMLNTRIVETRSFVESRIVSTLREYRNLYAMQIRNYGRFVYPSTLKNLMPYGLGLLKSPMLRGSSKDVSADDRSAAIFDTLSLSLSRLLLLLYPRMFNLQEYSNHANDGAHISLPQQKALTMGSLLSEGIFLLDNGRMILLWVGKDVSSTIMTDLFGDSASNRSRLILKSENTSDAGSPTLKALTGLIEHIRNDAKSTIPLYVIPQGEAIEAFILPFLIEDRAAGSQGYGDFIGMLHRNSSMPRGMSN